MAEKQECICCDSGYDPDFELDCPALGHRAMFCAMCMHQQCHLGEEVQSFGHFAHRFTHATPVVVNE